jgi:hypothetical protein
MALTPEQKKSIVAQYGASATDTGSPEAQVALLSKRIEDLNRAPKVKQALITTTVVVYCFLLASAAVFCSTLQRQISLATAQLLKN